jgi:dCMP deaminase
MAQTIALRAYDEKLKVGSVIVSDDNTRVLAVGYNGNYRGGPNARDSLEPGKSGMLHSELNALLKLNYHDPVKKRLYVTSSPCTDCAKCIIQSSIDEVIFLNVFTRDPHGIALLQSNGITVRQLTSTYLGDPEQKEAH